MRGATSPPVRSSLRQMDKVLSQVKLPGTIIQALDQETKDRLPEALEAVAR